MTDLEDQLGKEFGFSRQDIEKLSPARVVARKTLGMQLSAQYAQPAMYAVVVSSILEIAMSGSETSFGDEILDEVIDESGTDESSFQALVEVIVQLSEERKALPIKIAYFARDFLLGDRKQSRPRGAPKKNKRDEVITDAVREVLRVSPDLNPTRNPASVHLSACSLVAEELEYLNKRNKNFPIVNEASVNKIWNRLK